MKLTTTDGRVLPSLRESDEATSATIELDDRSFLFPPHKPVTHLIAARSDDGVIELSAVYAFNQTKHDTRICALSYADCQQLSRKMIDAYYQGRTQNVLSETAQIGIVFNPNGFVFMFQQANVQCDLFMSPSSVLRFTKALLQILDRVLPVVAH